MKDDLLPSFVTSIFIHGLFGLATCTTLVSFKVDKNEPMEIEIASIGDFDQEMGGTGLGELETPQPMESTTEVIKESEILPDDKIESFKEPEKPAEIAKPEKAPETVAPDPEPTTKEGEITPGETIPLPVKKEKKVEPVIEKPKSEKVDRKPKKKPNAIIDLVAKKKKVDDDFDSLFDSLSQDSKLNLKKRKSGASSKIKGKGGGGGGTALSSGDYDIIKKQVIPYWIVPTGLKNYEQYVIKLKINVKEDGSISHSDISVEDVARYNTDRMYRIAADSAKRALLQASPLNLPKEKLRNLKNFLIVFDPRDAI